MAKSLNLAAIYWRLKLMASYINQQNWSCWLL